LEIGDKCNKQSWKLDSDAGNVEMEEKMAIAVELTKRRHRRHELNGRIKRRWLYQSNWK
jgi:hypothetical protein